MFVAPQMRELVFGLPASNNEASSNRNSVHFPSFDNTSVTCWSMTPAAAPAPAGAAAEEEEELMIGVKLDFMNSGEHLGRPLSSPSSSSSSLEWGRAASYVVHSGRSTAPTITAVMEERRRTGSGGEVRSSRL